MNRFRKATPPTPSVSTLQAKRNYNLAHSKSRVANILSKPGDVRYTNKEAIEARYQKAIEELKKVEHPHETVSAIRSVTERLASGISSQAARETGAVVLTIPVGVAQLLLKGLRLFLSVLILVFIDLPLGVMSGSPAVNLAAAVAPNTGFQTTQSAYGQARRFTGANTPPITVKNYA